MTLHDDSEEAELGFLTSESPVSEIESGRLGRAWVDRIEAGINQTESTVRAELHRERSRRIAPHRSLRSLGQSCVSLFPANCMDDDPSVMLVDLVDKWSEEKTDLLGRMGDVLLLGVQAACARIRSVRDNRRNLVEPIVGATQVVQANLHDLFADALTAPKSAYTDTPLVLKVASKAEELSDPPRGEK